MSVPGVAADPGRSRGDFPPEKADSKIPFSALKTVSYFFDRELMAEYQAYQRAFFDIYLMISLFIICLAFYVVRLNILHPFGDGIYFTYAFFCSNIALCLYIPYVNSYVIKHCSLDEKSKLHRVSEYILNTPHISDLIKDLMAVNGLLGVCFALMGRIMNGACPENVTLWEAQRCNPMASCFSLPLDHVLYITICPLVIQLVINGMTYRGTFLCWLISTITLIFAVIEVQGRLEYWIFLCSGMVLVVSFRFEKLARVTFAHNKMTAVAEKEKRKYILLQQFAEHDLLSEKIKKVPR